VYRQFSHVTAGSVFNKATVFAHLHPRLNVHRQYAHVTAGSVVNKATVFAHLHPRLNVHRQYAHVTAGSVVNKATVFAHLHPRLNVHRRIRSCHCRQRVQQGYCVCTFAPMIERAQKISLMSLQAVCSNGPSFSRPLW